MRRLVGSEQRSLALQNAMQQQGEWGEAEPFELNPGASNIFLEVEKSKLVIQYKGVRRV